MVSEVQLWRRGSSVRTGYCSLEHCVHEVCSRKGKLLVSVFGLIIVTIACHVGLRTTGGTAGVGRSTTVAVVAGSVAVIAADFFVTQLLIALLY